jgi:hypothetical protein
MRDFRWSKWHWHRGFWGFGLRNPSKSNALPEIGKRWIRQCGHFLQCGRSATASINETTLCSCWWCVASNCVWFHKIQSVTYLGMFAVYEVPVTKQRVCKMTFKYCWMLWISKKSCFVKSDHDVQPCCSPDCPASDLLINGSRKATRKCVCIRVTWRKNAAWLLQRNGGGGGHEI